MINLNNVVKSYNGKIGCMCGCNGNYSLPESSDLNEINKSYGFENYSTKDVSNRRVKTAINKVNKALTMSEEELENAGLNTGISKGLNGESFAYVDSGSRTTVVYFKA